MVVVLDGGGGAHEDGGSGVHEGGIHKHTTLASPNHLRIANPVLLIFITSPFPSCCLQVGAESRCTGVGQCVPDAECTPRSGGTCKCDEGFYPQDGECRSVRRALHASFRKGTVL